MSEVTTSDPSIKCPCDRCMWVLDPSTITGRNVPTHPECVLNLVDRLRARVLELEEELTKALRCRVCGVGDGALHMVGCSIRELGRLEEQLRWRKWPEEKPEKDKEYWVLCDDRLNDNGKLYPEVRDGWEIQGRVRGVLYFRPIGPMPGVGHE